MYTAPARSVFRRWGMLPLLVMSAVIGPLVGASPLWADGKIFVPRDYEGSVEERSQEAILIFHGSDEPDGAVEDCLLADGELTAEDLQNLFDGQRTAPFPGLLFLLVRFLFLVVIRIEG